MSGRDTWSAPSSFDDFDQVEWIASGGMGAVYRARDVLLDRFVAIKIATDLERRAHVRERFAIEIRALARVQHPNVVAVYRAGNVDGRPYLAQELLVGRRLDRLPRPVPWRRVVAIGRGLARAIAASHACGVIHRDIKPSNVMLLRAHRVKLFDFGLAHLVGAPLTPVAFATGSSDTSSTRLTECGGVAGTPAYLAPELWMGSDPSTSSDVYALGLVLYELLVGDLPSHHLSQAALALAVVNHDLPRVAIADTGLPDELCTLIDRCVARAPSARPGSAAAVRDALDRIAAKAATHAPPRERARDALDRHSTAHDDVPTETVAVPR